MQQYGSKQSLKWVYSIVKLGRLVVELIVTRNRRAARRCANELSSAIKSLATRKFEGFYYRIRHMVTISRYFFVLPGKYIKVCKT